MGRRDLKGPTCETIGHAHDTAHLRARLRHDLLQPGGREAMAKERVQRAIQAVKEARFVPTCPPWARSEIAQLIYDVEAREPNLVQRYAGKLSASGLELIELGCNFCMADAWGALNKHYRRIPFRIEELFLCIHAALRTRMA